MSERRYKSREELSVGEILEYEKTHILPERDEYKQLRAEALEAAGLEGDTPPGDVPIEDLDVEGHFQRIRRH